MPERHRVRPVVAGAAMSALLCIVPALVAACVVAAMLQKKLEAGR